MLAQRAADPRHRGPDRACCEDLGVEVELARRERAPAAGRTSIATRASTRPSRPRSAPRSCSPARCSPASARSTMPPPGGDTIGRRRLDPHLDAFRDLGADVTGDRMIEISARRRPEAVRDLHGRALGDGHRERAARRGADPGPTTIGNAACEPHVQDLARLLSKMGAQIDGIGSNVMTVHGRDKLGGADHTICPDHIEVGSFMALAAATGGELRIRDDRARRPDHDPPPVPPPRPADDDRGPRRDRPAAPGARRPATTSATRSRRSTTAPGRPSRPT